jgi:superfamily II DNA or RNA helicase
MYNFYWTPLKTYCEVQLPQEVIDKVFFNQSTYFTRYDEVTHRKTPYPIKRFINWNFYDAEEKSFPSGFLSDVLNMLDIENYTVQYNKGKPEKILLLDDFFNNYLAIKGYELRDFQSFAGQLVEDYGSGVFDIGTAGGKTLMYGEIIRKLGVKTFVLTTDTISRDQTYNELCQFFNEKFIGRIDKRDFDKPILVANIANAWAKRDDEEYLNYIKDVDLLIVNEAHHLNESKLTNKSALANTWFNIVQQIPAYYRVAATGTVGEEGSFKRFLLTAAIGPVIYKKTTREFIDEGLASPIEAHIWKIDSNNDEHIQYTKAYENMITDVKFNQLLAKLAIEYSNQDKKVIIFCDWKEKQAKLLNNIILENGAECYYIDGDIKGEDRWSLVRQFEENKSSIMVTTVFSEDFNLPVLDVGIIVGKKKNEVTLKQRIGRLTRLFDGKEKGIIVIPFVQDWKKVTVRGQTKLVDGILAKHSNIAIEILKREGHSIIYKN